MGQKRLRRERFLAEHPICCFCGGEQPATTIDHVPNRASFPNREGPEGYEFPACDACQQATRLDEIAFSVMVHVNADDPDVDVKGFLRVVEGLRNNLPHLHGFHELSTNQKRHAIRNMGIQRPQGMALSEMPLVTIPDGYHDHMRPYICKISRALFYKHAGRIARPDTVGWAAWSTGKGGAFQSTSEKWEKITPVAVRGARTNVEIGDRFRYRVNYSDTIDAFAVTGQFSRGMRFFGLLMPGDMVEHLDQEAFAFGIEDRSKLKG
jgi:hypothetical protein